MISLYVMAFMLAVIAIIVAPIWTFRAAGRRAPGLTARKKMALGAMPVVVAWLLMFYTGIGAVMSLLEGGNPAVVVAALLVISVVVLFFLWLVLVVVYRLAGGRMQEGENAGGA